MTLSPTNFTFVSRLVRQEASIILEPGKEYLVEGRLLTLARKAGVSGVDEFLTQVQSRIDLAANHAIVDALTTNETSWFRDREPFQALTDAVMPALVTARAATRNIRIWSAACSSGQEPYSIAMLMEDALPAGWRYEVMASDISSEMIKRAETGEFTQVEMNRGLPAQMLVRHFERHGTAWRISPALRRSVTFRRLNLDTPLPSHQPFDVIFLRNVLIYFDVATKRSVLKNVSQLLRPDGWLFLGAAETTIGVDDRFERVAAGRASAYRLKAPVPASTARKG
ncbi:MAG TPA: protein-glutamate O-methyltransferase CheR [Rugosimonospora sp.]|nr:protein-glutamate O-methyltransferase CheR [Rugosimonospora sp.]